MHTQYTRTIHTLLFIYLPRPQHSSSQWCGSIFRSYVGCRCCCTQPGHSKQKSVFTVKFSAFWFPVRFPHPVNMCSAFHLLLVQRSVLPLSPEHTCLNVVISRNLLKKKSVIFSFLHSYWQIGLQAVGNNVPLCSPPPHSVLAWIKSMLGFLGQHRAFIIDCDKSGYVAVPTADNSQWIILQACVNLQDISKFKPLKSVL